MIFPGYFLLQTQMSINIYYNIMELSNIYSFLNYFYWEFIQFILKSELELEIELSDNCLSLQK